MKQDKLIRNLKHALEISFIIVNFIFPSKTQSSDASGITDPLDSHSETVIINQKQFEIASIE